MLKSPNVATPATAGFVSVPDNTPAPGLAPIPIVTLPVNAGVTLLLASWAVTCTAGVIAAPATVLPGCTVKSSLDVAPGAMLNGVLLGAL